MAYKYFNVYVQPRLLFKGFSMNLRYFTFIMVLALCSFISPSISVAENSEPQFIISNAWIKYNPMQGRLSAAYMDIENTSDVDGVLVGTSAQTPIHTMMHESIEEDGITKMLHLESVSIGAGTNISFAPRGLHIMLMNMPSGLEVGSTLPMVLEFANGEKVEAQYKVCPLTASTIC